MHAWTELFIWTYKHVHNYHARSERTIAVDLNGQTDRILLALIATLPFSKMDVSEVFPLREALVSPQITV